MASLPSPVSRYQMRRALERVARLLSQDAAGIETFPWALLRYPQVALLRTLLSERGAPRTANWTLAAVRGTLRAAWRLDPPLLTTDELLRTLDGLKGTRGRSAPAGRLLPREELRRLADQARGDGARGARNGAILALGFGAGLRRAELLALAGTEAPTPPALEIETGRVLILRGKGRKDRVTFTPPWGRALLREWWLVRGPAPGPVVCRVERGGHVLIRSMSGPAFAGILRRWAHQADVPPFSAHDLRRSFISHLLSQGSDLAVVQRLAGHSSPETTVLYDLRPEQEAAREVERLEL